jgi:RNA-directed DNA polymerase
MPKDAPPNGDAPTEEDPATDVPVGPRRRVSEMQAKVHRWAAADPGRRFDDLFNLVHDPATLIVAWDRVANNRGAKTAGSDGWTVTRIEAEVGVTRFLDDLRMQIKSGEFRPQPVRERKIPKPGGSGKVRRLGIPTVADRVVQAALKLVLEPIFEADFEPVSYGFRPRRRAHDAIAEIHLFGTKGYRWVLDADIEACFDSIDHAALMDRVRVRVRDKRVLRLVKAFLKAGILTELGEVEDTETGTPQGGILSPLLANIALSVLDEYLHAGWKPGGSMSTSYRRQVRKRKDLPNWRLVRYADDFVVLTDGTQADLTELREEIAQVLAPLGLRFSQAKTRIVHMSEGFEFLGFRIQWKPKRGTNKWYVYTFIADRPFQSVKAKIRALTPRTSQHDLRALLIRINQITRGWTNYFKHAIAQRTFSKLQQYVWWRIVRMMRTWHRSHGSFTRS